MVEYLEVVEYFNDLVERGLELKRLRRQIDLVGDDWVEQSTNKALSGINKEIEKTARLVEDGS